MTANAEMLSGLSLFARMTPEGLDALTARATLVKIPKDGTVYRKGDAADALHVVISGRCQSQIDLPGGGTRALTIYGPGETFGERPLLANDKHWSTVRVISDCTLLKIPGEDVQVELDRNPAFARLMARRMNEQFDSLREHPERRDVHTHTGRVAAFASVLPAAASRIVIENLALALRRETGRSVLLLTAHGNPGASSLSGWEAGRTYLNSSFCFAKDVREETGGVARLELHASTEIGEAEKIAAFISHTAQHFSHVLIHADESLPPHIAMAFLIQADASYLLLRQIPDDLVRANLLIRHMKSRADGPQARVLPVVCAEAGERPGLEGQLEAQIGEPPHAWIRGIPEADPHPERHYLDRPDDRFSKHIRNLAREIGRRRVGIVFASGGAKSFACIGVIEVLEENGIDVDIVAGASMGAYLGALWCHGLSGADIHRLALDMEKPGALFRLLDFSLMPRRGFIHGNRIRRLLERSIGDVHFSQLERPLRVVATDLATLEREVLDTGQVSHAVHASMAMPGVFAPVELGGRVYIDGGACDPLPVDVLSDLNVDHIIAVDTIPNIEDLKAFQQVNRTLRKAAPRDTLAPLVGKYVNYFHPGNILDTFVRSMQAAEIRIATKSVQNADVVLRAVACDGLWHDFRHASRYIHLGRLAAEQNLEALKALVAK